MKNLAERLETLKKSQEEKNKIHVPLFYRLNSETDYKKFSELLEIPGLTIVDFLEDQVKELIKSRSPHRKFSTDELNSLIKLHMGSSNGENYGVWVFYPWSNRLVHLLDEEEFVEVRTSRNQYKITPEEKKILAKKKIGVVGLSVGQSVSVTLAMERICGELRLADFDLLELTNLNRIRTGVHNLGLYKVYSVAREIAEIDPFLKVVCYPQGLTETNMELFFTEGGKLDLLAEESDGFDIKILCRYKARELRIPVIMEGSDRCLVDVERFDLEPERSILHGLVDHLDIGLLKTLRTNEEKIPYMLDILGLESSSLRLKASMLEIEQTINTWPQLASAVTMGGGITADVCRRMLLNHFTESGRYHVDIEDLIGNNAAIKTDVPEVSYGSLPSISDFVLTLKDSPAGNSKLQQKDAETIVKAAITAPSGGNSQPWRWVFSKGSLFLFNGLAGDTTFLGYGNLASFVALGASLENAILKAGELGYRARVFRFPSKTGKDLVARIDFEIERSFSVEKNLALAISPRLTNRMLGSRKKIGDASLEKIKKAAEAVNNARLHFLETESELEDAAELLGELEKIRLLEPTGHKDFVSELRWSKEENDIKRDGIDLRTLDLTASEKVGLEVAKDPQVIEMLRHWGGGGAFKKLTRKSVEAAGAIGVLTMKRSDLNNDFLEGGRALERAWLMATAEGIAFQPMAASVFVFGRLLYGGGVGLEKNSRSMLEQLRGRYEKLFDIRNEERELFIFRLSSADEPEIKSLRKPLHELYCVS
jgi:tRNA A37 threonylcarbamoyladenosine dehydratase